ncbi:MAG: amylo-alpha-1,6-glucosidase [Terriglobales bacterium]
MQIRFDRHICGDLQQALRREWLETNGLGGFAGSSIVGLNTRRYHGLLVAATKPPVGRFVLLSKLEETLVLDGNRFELSVNQYSGAVHPQGHQYLKEFRLDPFPVFTYEVEDCELVKSLFMVQGQNSTVVRYRVSAPPGSRHPVRLEVRPLIAFRDYHSTTHENPALNPQVSVEPGCAMVRPYADLPRLWFAHNGEVHPGGYWYRSFEYECERARGLDFSEDLFNPMVITFDAGAGDSFVIASTERRNAAQAMEYEAQERRRRTQITQNTRPNGLERPLTAAADQFIVARGEQKTVIAGYHWFADWGRDTMISLPGLTLATGRPEVAWSILLEFAQHVNRGMLPNRFPDAGEEPEYNTVDATLWFIEAIRKYLDYTGDFESVRAKLYPVLADIMQWHFRGTRHGIRMDSDGLLACGEPGVQLTWMDAKVGDWVVTPRHGKPVEIQALWHNALVFMRGLSSRFGYKSDAQRYAAAAKTARTSFAEKFWNPDRNCLFDVINGTERDASIRPNQIFAVSLPPRLLSAEKEQAVVKVVQRELLTPYGLRTLDRGDPQYRGSYGGDPWSRDAAYHQGTVWPWLLGPFVTAYLKVHKCSPAALEETESWLGAFEQHLGEEGLGQVSEVFSGDPPHQPGGCIAQAWSVAELLRATEELAQHRRGQRSDMAASA